MTRFSKIFSNHFGTQAPHKVTYVGSVQIIMNKLSGDRQKCVQLKKLKPPGLDFLEEMQKYTGPSFFLAAFSCISRYLHLLAL